MRCIKMDDYYSKNTEMFINLNKVVKIYKALAY